MTSYRTGHQRNAAIFLSLGPQIKTHLTEGMGQDQSTNESEKDKDRRTNNSSSSSTGLAVGLAGLAIGGLAYANSSVSTQDNNKNAASAFINDALHLEEEEDPPTSPSVATMRLGGNVDPPSPPQMDLAL